MSSTQSIEERLSVLEREVAELKKRNVRRTSIEELANCATSEAEAPSRSWVDEIAGSMSDIEHIDEFVRLAREARQSMKG